jgi:hypothetical protein
VLAWFRVTLGKVDALVSRVLVEEAVDGLLEDNGDGWLI